MTHVSPAPGAGPWVEAWLSPARFGVYLYETGGDRARALELYRWNSELSCAVLRDLGHFEVALRNAYATALDATWSGPGHWLDDPASPLRAPLLRTKRGGPRGPRQVDINDKPRRAIDAARSRYGVQALPGKIIADLSLGLWRYLSSSAHEKTLWVPHLHRAFPAGTNRATVDRKIGDLHGLRNRAAHWEPLLAAPLARRMGDLVWVAGLLSPELADFVQHHSEVAVLLAKRP
ncbi:hypothetical protein [Streptomyces albidoflavus]|uniref:hypothetical protein n=1 Tax=Streptomyces albidoflavus TaxID=1886 RepID=UPI00188B1579|nr:hypothetical protein [Streptomyces albidoflavus]MBF4138171.1 hypothetical protein [Streptomyces albidoflavus]